MPHYHKIITLLFLISFGFFLTFNIVLAQQVEVNLQVPIYGQDVVRSSDPNNPAGLLSAYIALIYTYALGIASTLAVVMIMVGGFIWLTSAGSPDRVGLAKDFITSAITGLIIALFSYIILQTINPNLVTNQAPIVASPADIAATTAPIATTTVTQSGNAVLQQAIKCLTDTGVQNQLAGFQKTSELRPNSEKSCHSVGMAVDFAWTNMTNAQVNNIFCQAVASCELFTNCYNEVSKPADSPDWTGPHVHLAVCNCKSGPNGPVYDTPCSN